MRRTLATLTSLCLVVAACGGGDDDDTSDQAGDDGTTAEDDTGDAPDAAGNAADGDTGDADDAADSPTETTSPDDADPPAGLPAECAETSIDLSLSEVAEYSGPVEIGNALGVATPIVPNGDGSLDDLTPSDFNDLGAETDLLLYTQWVGDHDFVRDDIGFFSGPEAPDGSVTLGLTVVPTSAGGLSTGDVIASQDEFEFDSITTFGSVGLFFDPAEDVETYFLVNNLDEDQGGTAEVLYVDDAWLCVQWDLAGETRDPEGTYQLTGVVVTPLERATTPFT